MQRKLTGGRSLRWSHFGVSGSCLPDSPPRTLRGVRAGGQDHAGCFCQPSRSRRPHGPETNLGRPQGPALRRGRGDGSAGVSAFSQEASIILLGPAGALLSRDDSASSGPLQRSRPPDSSGVLSPVCSHPLPALENLQSWLKSLFRGRLAEKNVCASHCYTICHVTEKLSHTLVPPLFTATLR